MCCGNKGTLATQYGIPLPPKIKLTTPGTLHEQYGIQNLGTIKPKLEIKPNIAPVIKRFTLPPAPAGQKYVQLTRVQFLNRMKQTKNA